MGNRICRPRRSTVDDRFTRPQRLVREPSNVDYKKLRKLILSQKLAPCFDVVEDSNPDLEECPICFFYFPSLNRSKCCMKGICTECFLQMKPSNATPSAQCPFCKTPCYAVEYRGARTQEEKGLEQAEEQRVIEAKIRMQQRESQNGNQVILANQNSSPMEVQSPMSGSREPYNGEVQDFRGSELSLASEVIEFSGSPVNAWNERHQEFGLDLEEIMMMEAIWQSIRDSGLLKSTAQQSSGSTGEANRLNQSAPSLALVGQEELRSSDSVTGGIAVAIARLAEHNILRSEISQSIHGNEIMQTQNENYTEEHQGRMLGPTFHGADMLDEGPLRPAMNPEFDDMHSESGCLASCCSTTEDESWELQSAYSLNGSQCSSDGSICDEDPVAESIDVESSCSSSIHTISDSSCGSPNCFDTGGSPGCPEFSGPITVDRQLRAFANSSA